MSRLRACFVCSLVPNLQVDLESTLFVENNIEIASSCSICQLHLDDIVSFAPLPQLQERLI